MLVAHILTQALRCVLDLGTPQCSPATRPGVTLPLLPRRQLRESPLACPGTLVTLFHMPVLGPNAHVPKQLAVRQTTARHIVMLQAGSKFGTVECQSRIAGQGQLSAYRRLLAHPSAATRPCCRAGSAAGLLHQPRLSHRVCNSSRSACDSPHGRLSVRMSE